MPELRSYLRPSESVQIGLLTGIIAEEIYRHNLPAIADIRTAEPHNKDIETARRQAAWTSTGMISFIALITRDWNVFLIGGLVVGSIDIIYKHANAVHPSTGKLNAPGESAVMSPELSTAYPLPDYSSEDAA